MDTGRYPERAQNRLSDHGSSISSADSNTRDAEAATLVWTCQTKS